MKTTITSLIFLLSLSAFTFADTIEKTYPWIEYDATAAPPAEKIQAGCGALSMDEKSIKTYKPDFPLEAFQARTSGYVVLDFQIDENGAPKNIEIVATTSKVKAAFLRQSKSKLRTIKFNLSDDWLKSCTNQTYRIGYAYRLMSECTYTEFPKPIIGVCSTGMIERILP